MRVDYEAAKGALERLDGEVPGQPKVTVHLSDPAADGSCELTITGSHHATEEGVAAAIGLQPPQAIDRYTPSPTGFVVSELGRPPSPGAAQASLQPKGRLPAPAVIVKRPDDRADLVEANAPSRKGTPKGRKQ